MTEQWALLWSKKQNAFHVETVSGWLSKNRVAYRDNATLKDYHPIYIGDKEGCHSIAHSVRFTLIARDQDLPEVSFQSVHTIVNASEFQGANAKSRRPYTEDV